MTTQIICPTLIIIFSILIFFAIINNQRIKKLNDNVEQFDAPVLNAIQQEKVESDLEFSTALTQKIINGKWTWYSTSVDQNNNATSLMEISVSDTQTPVGTITIPKIGVFQINFIVDENINAYHIKNKSLSMHIHILRVNKDSQEDIDVVTKPWFTNSTYTSIVSIFMQNTLLVKFSSYKMLSDKVDPVVYTIIKGGDIFREYPPPLYDLKTYKVLISDNYVYPPNCITVDSFNVNPNKDASTKNSFDKLKSFYGDYGNIGFSIRRVFTSPSNNEIWTRISNNIVLNCIQGGMMANNIKITSFQADKDANNLVGFFIPKATILYFYQLTKSSTSYSFEDPTVNIVNTATALSLQDVHGTNASDNFFTSTANSITKPQNKNMAYNNIKNVQKVNNSTYTIRMVGRELSNLNDPTIIPFAKLLALI